MLHEQVVLPVKSATRQFEADLRGSASVLIEVLVCIKFLLQIFFFFLLSNITIGDTQETSAL